MNGSGPLHGDREVVAVGEENNGQALALSADTPAASSRTTPLNEVRIVNR